MYSNARGGIGGSLSPGLALVPRPRLGFRSEIGVITEAPCSHFSASAGLDSHGASFTPVSAAAGVDRLTARPNGKKLVTGLGGADQSIGEARPSGYPFPNEGHGPYTAFMGEIDIILMS
jgi:hypothetical protein|eukprot:COSAG01_NODE_20079_length_972_cov_0.991982_3_plen_119_part_00